MIMKSLLLAAAATGEMPSAKPPVAAAIECVLQHQARNENVFRRDGESFMATVALRDTGEPVHLIITRGLEKERIYIDGANYQPIDGSLDFDPTDLKSPPTEAHKKTYQKDLAHLAQSCPNVA